MNKIPPGKLPPGWDFAPAPMFEAEGCNFIATSHTLATRYSPDCWDEAWEEIQRRWPKGGYFMYLTHTPITEDEEGLIVRIARRK